MGGVAALKRATRLLGGKSGLGVTPQCLFKWEAPGIHLFLNVPCTPCAAKSPLPFRKLVARRTEPGLIAVQVTTFRRVLNAFYQQLCRHRDIVSGKQTELN